MKGNIQRRVVAAHAHKMGGTEGIARCIGDELTRAGLSVEVRDADTVRSVDRLDAAVAGSALHQNRWRPGAVDPPRRHVRRGSPA
jgi:menaquinone-dependent protoporphyrinogen oxidase